MLISAKTARRVVDDVYKAQLDTARELFFDHVEEEITKLSVKGKSVLHIDMISIENPTHWGYYFTFYYSDRNERKYLKRYLKTLGYKVQIKLDYSEILILRW